MKDIDITISKKQKQFMTATETEILYGGAAGGGKSYGQLLDAYLYALQYPKSKQIIFRRTFPDLERSLIRVSRDIYRSDLCKYNEQKHTYRFINGSIIDFGYINYDSDVYQYQSAEYDVIRFDELTHFTEFQYTYLMSRCRGANSYPKQIKSSTNPGGIGHTWVRARFIDIAPPNTLIDSGNGTRRFIPAKVQDNQFLMESDPDYLKRLENLDEAQKKALLYGDWDIFEGQYFSEWNREVHVIKPFEYPSHWRKYIAFDYGLDMFACLLAVVDEHENVYVINEIHESGLIVSDAVSLIKQRFPTKVEAVIAPPDLWNRHSDTGKSTAEIFADNGVPLVKCSNDRVQGWYNLHEMLKIFSDEQSCASSRLKITENCVNLIRCLPALQFDAKNPNDVAREPHDITHITDALRYLMTGRPYKAVVEKIRDYDEPPEYDEQIEDFINF